MAAAKCAKRGRLIRTKMTSNFLIWRLCLVLFVGVLSRLFVLAVPDDTLQCSRSSCLQSTATAGDEKRYCHCETNCIVFNDCCFDAPLSTSSPVLHEGAAFDNDPDLQCVNTTIVTNDQKTMKGGYKMIIGCPSSWKSSLDSLRMKVSTLCEEIPPDTEPPVTHQSAGIVYRNKYCGLCHNITMDQLVEWPSKWSCDENFEALFNISSVVNSTVIHSLCFPQRFIPPKISATQLPVRPCWPLVSNCPATPPLNLTVPVDYETLVVNCTIYGINQVVSSTGAIYKNTYCAYCNGEKVESNSIRCDSRNTSYTDETSNSANRISAVIQKRSEQLQLFTINQSDSQRIYELSHVSCIDGFNIVDNACAKSVYLLPLDDHCIYGTLNKSDYTFLDSVTVLQHGKDNNTFTISKFGMNGSVSVCLRNESDSPFLPVSLYPAAFFAIIIAGFLLNITAGAMLLLTYSIFKELRTFYGKLLMNMSAVIIVENILFVLTFFLRRRLTASDQAVACQTVAIFSHYFLLLRFMSMSVLTIEVCQGFCAALKLKKADEKTWKHLILYISLQHVLCLVVIVICVILNYTVENSVGYGPVHIGVCWINNPISVIWAFIVPCGLLVVFNIALFSFCVYVLVKLWSSEKRAGEDTENGTRKLLWRNVRILFAILAVSGPAWLLTAVVEIDRTVDHRKLWLHYLLVIFNVTQLVFIAAAYICTRKVAKLYKGLFSCRFSTDAMEMENA